MGKKNRGYQPPPRPPGPAAPSAFSAADPPREALPPPPPVPAVQPVVERIQDLLTQFVGVVNRLGDELSPVRIATAVERQIGATPSVIQDAVTAHRDLREAIGEVQRKLTQVDAQLVGLGSRATTEQVRSAIETAMQPELLRAGQRIEQVRTALEALTQRTSSGQISVDVQTAASELTKQYRVELESKLTRLQQAFDFLDNQSTELRNLIDSFEPGGLPVLKQANDALQAQLDQERAAHAETRETLQKRTEILTEKERELFGLKAGQGSLVSIEDLEKQRKELAEEKQQLIAWTALSAENARLRKDVDDLNRELEEHERELEVAHLAAEERAELERLRRELAAEERARHKQEELRVQMRQDLTAQRRQNQELKTKLQDLIAAEELATRRDERIRTLEEENKTLRANVEEQRTRETRERTERENQRQQIASLRDDLQRQRERETLLESEWRKQHQDQWAKEARELHERERAWAEQQARTMSQQVATDLAAANEAIEELEQNQAELKRDLAKRQKEIADLQNQLSRAQTELEVERARVSVGKIALAEERTRQEEHIARREAEANQRLANQQQDTLTRLTSEEKRVQDKLTSTQLEVGELKKEIADLSGQRGELKVEVQGLEQRRQDLRDKVLPREARLGPLQEKVFKAEELAATAPAASEVSWLSGIQEGLFAAGYSFHPRLLRAFHTSLKIAKLAPLTVLAGISGTGKSELPRLYSDLGGVSFLPIPVQPSWDSPQDLLGFFNYTDGRYKAEPLSRLLYQINQKHDPLGQGLSIVLLDEMNLARVEYYFAELLSRLEARRSVDPSRSSTLARASVHLDIGAGEEAEALYLDPRVLFVGTMNEDESTLTLSAKVLDRACILSFPRPRDMRVQEQAVEIDPRERLPADMWQSWYREPEDDHNSEELNRISATMDQLDRSFGHRLFRAIHAYVGNYPAVDVDSDSARRAAWEDQWSMKILPRLKGLERDDKRVRQGLDELAQLVPERLRAAYKRARERDYFDWGGCPELYHDDAGEPGAA